MAKTFSFDLMVRSSDSFSYDEADMECLEEEYMEKPNTSIEGKIILWNDLDNKDKADWIVRHQDLRVDSCDEATYVENIEWSEELQEEQNCIECNQSTKFGSGKFINRISTDTDDYICEECFENGEENEALQ